MVPAVQPQSQWGMSTAPASTNAAAASFDPFAAPPAPAPAPPPAPVPTAATAYDTPFGSQNYGAPAPAPSAVAPAPAYYSEPPASAPAPPQQQTQYQQQQEAQLSTYNGNSQNDQHGTGGFDQPGTEPKQEFLNNYNDRQMVAADKPTTVAVRSPEEVRNKYSQALAQQAGPAASPLPKAELVRKKGYVLSRISFRTIVMKKWKQSFWVQYGSHTMLWFRNESDFDDWLNNPYHNQAQRNFLIKLAVNFVHDLYKPNVRGYQVTQCRSKPYGTKVVRQFKLERWMDYGPTIAAAFGSYDPKEVDACREAIVECMKNTPLDNGIRATGAVKEHHERQQAAMHHHQQNGGDGGGGGGERYQNYQLPPNARGHAQSMDAYGQRSAPVPSSQSMASATDLLGDDTGINDSASVPPTSMAETGDLLGAALVPATNPNAAYPGAPPPQYPPTTYPQGNAYPQNPMPPPQTPQPSYSAPQQMSFQQQQGTYGQSQPQGGPGAAQGYPQQQPQQYGAGAPPSQPAGTYDYDYGGYPQSAPSQPPQQQQGSYPMTSYPQPTQF
ncbi:MAG: hypothetical protein SGARI_000092 [Bacillariaceae sp.]